ncbi:MAG: M28 family peptidase [Anaerolineae bacterium]|nr:M28 family peptidase [Anaerolineae bacterium]
MADSYDVDREQQIATALRLGIAAAKAGRRAAAQRHLQQVLQLDPNNVSALLWLAGLLTDPWESLEYVQRALAVEPGNERALAALKWVQQRLGEGDIPPSALAFTAAPAVAESGKEEEITPAPATATPHRVPARAGVRPARMPVEAPRGARSGRFAWRVVLRNGPFLVGLVIVLALLFLALFGPRLATYNPYLTSGQTLEMIGGKLVGPPFPPGEKYPLGTDQWGRDIYSTLLWGARNTLTACLFVTMARLLIGLTLGALAGWYEGKLIDRVVMGLIEMMTSLPLLLVGMIAIFALDIRRGIGVFIIALCFVGWGEIAQYVRSEFMTLRQRPFVEGARVIGLNDLEMIVRHLLPNVLPSLVVLALLEMGAVLMILGELGFVGVFIGGGSTTETLSGNETFATIPEWGAMLAGARRYARSTPWMVFYPALAIFVSVLGFNFLSEGLRRIIRETGVNTAALLSTRMILVVALISGVTYYIVENVGPAKSYANLALRFDEERVREDIRVLCDEEHLDRRVGKEGAQAAADYIAAQFQAAGLEWAGKGQSYFQPWETRVAYPLEQPELALLDADGQVVTRFQHQVDFGERLTRHGGSGTAQAPLLFVGFSRQSYDYAAFRGLDLRGRIVLYFADNAPTAFDSEALIRGAEGILIIDEEARAMNQLVAGGVYMEQPSLPIFHITPAAANRLLEPAGLRVDELRARIEKAQEEEEEWFTQEVDSQVRMSLVMGPVEEVTAYNVLGMMPGADVTMNDELIIISAHYDNLGIDPDGTAFVGANDNAASVALLLEIARLWSEQEFRPHRSVLFAVWAGGQMPYSGVHAYFDNPLIYASSMETVAVFQLDRLGRGGGALLVDGDRNLIDLLRRSADTVGVTVAEEGGARLPYQNLWERRASTLLLSRERPATSYLLDDTADKLDLVGMSKAGQAINLALITIGREVHY